MAAMGEVAWVLLGLAALCAVGDWVSVGRGDKRLEYIFKPATMVALVGLAATLHPAVVGQQRWWLLALGLVVGFLTARMMALSVQDRVIRLEERLRYERMLPADMKPRIGEFTVEQLVSLRFASDAELPALARKVLDEKMTERKAIKQMVKSWKPDFLRA